MNDKSYSNLDAGKFNKWAFDEEIKKLLDILAENKEREYEEIWRRLSESTAGDFFVLKGVIDDRH